MIYSYQYQLNLLTLQYENDADSLANSSTYLETTTPKREKRENCATAIGNKKMYIELTFFLLRCYRNVNSTFIMPDILPFCFTCICVLHYVLHVSRQHSIRVTCPNLIHQYGTHPYEHSLNSVISLGTVT